MILFKQEHVAPILTGVKTQTRRGGMKRWNVGARHQCRTSMLKGDTCFAVVEILDVRREFLLDISPDDARAEGYESPDAYFAAWRRINKTGDLHCECWVVTFRLVDDRGVSE